jgi:hypothetical protein
VKKLFIIVMLIPTLFVIPVFGQETQETPEAAEIQETPEIVGEQEVIEVQETQEQPREIEFSKGLFTSYKYNDGEETRKLKLGELEKIIVSINDEEATRHFKKSKSLQKASFPFAAVGGFLMGWPIGGAISGKDFDMRIFGAGCGIATVGLALEFFAHKERAKSVERYNAVVKGEWGFNLQYLPENNQIGFNLRRSF